MDVPIGPVIQAGIALLGLVILVSMALGWRRGNDRDDKGPKSGS
jgi:hypothetical protein